jgi:hypothetical protein
MNQHIFVISNGVDTHTAAVVRENKEEAKKALESELHQDWYIVNDKKELEKFIKEANTTSEEIEQIKEQIKQIDIERQLEIARKGLEMGGQIGLHIYKDPSREEALKKIEVLSKLAGVTFKETQETASGWFSIDRLASDVDITVFYDLSKEEQIQKLQTQIESLKYMEEDVSFEEVTS